MEPHKGKDCLYFDSMGNHHTANIYSGNWDTRKKVYTLQVKSNLVMRNGLIRNKFVLRNHFPWPIANLLYKAKEHLALRNSFTVTKKFLLTKFSTVLGAVIKCKQYSGITMESGTPVKSVKNTLNIFAVSVIFAADSSPIWLLAWELVGYARYVHTSYIGT